MELHVGRFSISRSPAEDHGLGGCRFRVGLLAARQVGAQPEKRHVSAHAISARSVFVPEGIDGPLVSDLERGGLAVGCERDPQP